MNSSITFQKMCTCLASSSGPRLIQRGIVETEDGNFKVTFSFVFKACDFCNTPWQEVKK